MRDTFDVIRDVLDNQLVDREQRPLGRADGVVMEVRENAPPRLIAIEVGAVVLTRRLHPRLAAWLIGLGRRWRWHSRPTRIPFSKVRDVGIDIELDLLAAETPLLDTEDRLREQIVRRIPGAG